jgi:hypothetical protein
MRLLRAERGSYTGPAAFLADDDRRAEMAEYFADMTRPFGTEPDGGLSGQSYGEMAKALVAATATEPLDLLVLAFSIHDMWPGRATATYLSHLCPGTPLSFAICDQGSAAPFTALRVIRDSRPRRALLIVVEQATLPYACAATPPVADRGVAMLFGDDTGARITDLRQHQDVAPGAVAELASLQVKELSAGYRRVRLVSGAALAMAWPGHPGDSVPAGQPATGPWWHIGEALTGAADLVVVADYDPDLRYLCLVGVEASRPATDRSTKEQS